MAFDLVVDGARWRRHLGTVVEDVPGIVPVIKGNGYGFGRDVLTREAGALGVDTIAVGTYEEAPEALAGFAGRVLVLTPWRPFSPQLDDPRVIHTISRVEDVAALAASLPAATVVIEAETSMARHGVDRHELADVAANLGGLTLAGLSIHLPLRPTGNLAEAEDWAAVLSTSRLDTDTLYLSHLGPGEVRELARRRPQLTVRPRIGTHLWLGDLGALDVRATVLDVHTVERGERVGYRQHRLVSGGRLLVVAGGTSHGVGLEAPRAAGGVVDRGKTLARGGLAAAGQALSPFTIAGKQRWFVEPPHMQVSMVLLPGDVEPPVAGDHVSAAVRYTIASFDSVTFV